MRSGLRALAALCSIAISMNTGCSKSPASSGDVTVENDTSPVQLSDTSEAVRPASLHTVSEKDLSPVTSSGSAVTFSSDSVTVSGGGVTVTGTVATINKPGYYSISGSCPDGQIVVDCGSDDDVYLILNGVDLTCVSGPAVYCKKADKLTLTLSDGTENSLSDGDGYTSETAEDTGAALFSRDTLVINGSGSLTVNGNFKDGIKSKDGLKLCGGTLSVTAVEDGIIGRDYLLAASGTVTVNSGYDAMKSTNPTDPDKGFVNITGGSYTLNCGRDGIQAETDLDFSGGTISIVSGGGSATVEYSGKESFGAGWGRFSSSGSGFDFSSMTDEDGNSPESMKGLKAGSSITVSSGSITADCADDALHCNGSIQINGGSFTLSSGDDAVHADLLLTINNGEMNIMTSYEGLEANGIEINGGMISLRAFDDGINASETSTDGSTSPYISISGGSVTANADGDGIDSNGTVSMSGGTLVVFGPTSNRDGALDYDKSFAVCGGTLIALGSRGMAQAPSTLSQPCLSVYHKVSAGSTIEVRDANGKSMISTVTPKDCESLIFSTEDFQPGTEYSIYADDELLTTVTATDGVSGGGAVGSGSGTWSDDGAPWGGAGNDGGHNTDFTHPNKPPKSSSSAATSDTAA